jgi:hypothetical protein
MAAMGDPLILNIGKQYDQSQHSERVNIARASTWKLHIYPTSIRREFWWAIPGR